ncbi:universal stress protein [Pontibacter diazotrophicus]|nr:universal stress protein [Pontibacter diazotrophicus]
MNHTSEAARIHKILVPTDLSKEADNALLYAIEMA